MKNDNILIFGDSYSTFENHIPEGYSVYYPMSGDGSVSDVSHTWWHMLAKETDSQIVLNNSWSGSTICNTGYNGDCSKTNSFIFRLNQLIDKEFFDQNKIDRVLVFGGTNDSWSGNICGELMFADWTANDLRMILPGICCFIDRLLSVVEKENIHFIINTELREEVENGILEICRYHNIGYTKLSDIDKVNGHPTYKGMTQIKNQVISNLKD